MSNAYITLWSQAQVEIERRGLAGKATLDHAGSEQFRQRGVKRGDRLYVLATRGGRILLLGRLTVARIINQQQADRHFAPIAAYQATDHVVGEGTPLELDRVIPETIARQLARESGKRLKIDPAMYRVDPQSLRTTGRITAESAALLDQVLAERIQVDLDHGYREGARRERRHQVAERSAAVRQAALALQGAECRVCGFSFEATYGSLGADCAEIHHLVPMSKLRSAVLVDPSRDVIVLCANCHRMAHRRDPSLTPEELQALLKAASLPHPDPTHP